MSATASPATGGIRFVAACDFPTPFSQAFTLAPTSTFAQLKAALATALNTAAGVDASAAAAQDVKTKPGAKPVTPAGPIVAPASLAAYSLVIVKYRTAPIDIAGVRTVCTVCTVCVLCMCAYGQYCDVLWCCGVVCSQKRMRQSKTLA